MSETSQVSPRSDRPNLEQKKKLAKELLKAVRGLDAQQALRFIWNLPRFRGKSAQDVIREGASLADAQHVIARESGFESWPKLTLYIRQLHAEPHGPVAVFEDAVRAIIRGDRELLQRLLREHAELATMRSPRHHRAVLPHYVAANGIENEHQITPPNAVEIAGLLFDNGAHAVVDATADFYGGGGGSTPLVGLVTSTHPHEAGVQADLVHVFCDAGANANGIDNDGLPLNSALGFRYPKAAEALAACGARIENLPSAAALGRMDLVRQMLEPDARLASKACVFHNPLLRLPHSVPPHPDALLEQAFVFACMNAQREMAEFLLGHGVDVNAGPRNGVTALHEACYQGHLDVVRFLLDRGADPTCRDENWESTPLGWADGGKQPCVIDELFRSGNVDFLDAVEMKRHDIVRQQLESNPSLANGPSGQGAALRYAAYHGDIQLARLLLAYGADASLCNEAGLSALDYAEKAGHREMIELLKHG